MADERLLVSPYIAADSSDQSGSTVVHTLTGARFQLTNEALQILRAFDVPRSAAEVAAQLGIDRPDDAAWHDAVASLQANRLLIVNGTQESEEVTATRQALALQLQPPPFAFCGAPIAALDAIPSGSIAIAGIPLDSGTSGHAGARLAPDRIREISRRFVSYETDIVTGTFKGVYDSSEDCLLLRGKQLVDVGNVSIHLHEPVEETFRRCRDVARSIFRRGAIGLFLGGDHSISYPLIAAARETYEDLLVIHFDAHTDRATWLADTAHHHGNVMTRVLEELDVRIAQFGVRGFAGTPAVHDRCRTTTARRIATHLPEVLHELPSDRDCYISLDVDVLDPTFAPATGTPVPFGMHPDTVLELLSAIARRNRIRGIDVVEYSPPYDRDDCTGSLIFHLLMPLLHAVT